jgi:hypothetical protein
MAKIGPASRRHFYKALAHAGRAEMRLNASGVDRLQLEIGLAQVELLRGIAFSYLQPEDPPERTHKLMEDI